MIIVHHLETSRSTRILWLLEELGIEYELHRHARVNGRAPENLKHIHPLGKAPFIVDGDLVLAESSAILRYVDARYGNGRHSPQAGTAEGAMHDQWLDLAEGSASFPLLLPLLGRMMGGLPRCDGAIRCGAGQRRAYLYRRGRGQRLIPDGRAADPGRHADASIRLKWPIWAGRSIAIRRCSPIGTGCTGKPG
jgi:glutathione S-transferase